MDIVSEFQKRSWKKLNEFRILQKRGDFEGRVDLRGRITFTIDAKLDDAVHIKRLKNGNFELGVHIIMCLFMSRRL